MDKRSAIIADIKDNLNFLANLLFWVVDCKEFLWNVFLLWKTNIFVCQPRTKFQICKRTKQKGTNMSRKDVGGTLVDVGECGI